MSARRAHAITAKCRTQSGRNKGETVRLRGVITKRESKIRQRCGLGLRNSYHECVKVPSCVAVSKTSWSTHVVGKPLKQRSVFGLVQPHAV